MNRARLRRMIAGPLAGGGGDSVAPTVTITSAAVSPVIAAFSVTFTLSEVSTDFALGDITVGNGTAGNFAGSGTSYTCDITPSAGGAVTVDVAAGAFHDAAGNGNEAATQFSVTFYDVKISDTFTDANGTNLTAHTIAPTNVPGNAWTNIYSTGSRAITVQSNRAACPTLNERWYGREIGVADFVLTTILRLSSATVTSGIYLRLDALTDAAGTERNCWFVALGNGKIELYERNAATPGTLRATANMTTNGSQDYAVKVVCIGDTITVTVDGANQISYSGITTHLTSTKVGLKLQTANATVAIADDFKVFF